VVLGRWSILYTAILATTTVLGLAIGAWSMRPGARSPYPNPRHDPVWWLDAAAIALGLGYLIHAALLPDTASQALDLVITSSVIPASIVLDWIAMACLLVALALWARCLPARYATISLSLGAVLVAVLLLEGWARAAAILSPQVQGYPTMRSMVWRHRYVHVNRAGYRDVDHDTTPPADRRRLLMIGDSYGVGEGVDDPNDRLGAVLARTAEAQGGGPWEVIHVVRSNTHTLDHLEFLTEGLTYHPDIVILIYVFNDIEYLRPQQARDLVNEHPIGILARLRPDRFLVVNSFAVQELVARARQLRLQPTDRPSRANLFADSSIMARHLSDLTRFVERARAGGAAPVIVPVDAAVIVGPFWLERYQKFLADLRGANLPVWSLEKAFDGETLDAVSINQLDRHPNSHANRLAAMTLLPQFLELAEARRIAAATH
jgi:hypothetical protein